MPKDNIDYSNTIIYKIYCKNTNITDVYIGHTTNFCKRKYQHKTNCNGNRNLKLYNIIRNNGGWDNWFMAEIASYKCKNSTEARMKEQEHYNLHKATLNSNSPSKLTSFCVECKENFDNNNLFENHKCKKNTDNNYDKIYYDDKIPNLINYNCILCNYLTTKKNNFFRHKASDKHLKLLNLNSQNFAQNEHIEHNFENVLSKETECKCVCGVKYKHNNYLIKHKTECHYYNSISKFDNNNEGDVKALTNLVLEVVKQNQELVSLNSEAQKHNQELTNKLVEICGNVTNNTQINNNSHNKTFNLNVFLNETCKDAMNINEFIDSLQLQLSDLEDVGKLGFVEGISNIIIKNLKAMDIHKRPVHCADQKREVIYIKDEDKWEKENEQKQRLRKAIKRVVFKNEKLLPKYKEQHPGCNYSDSKFSEHYSKLVIEAMGGIGNNDTEKEDKIIKKITKEVIINKSNN
jgi:hypothetical protein